MFTRGLNKSQVVQALLKSGLIFLGKDALKIREASLKRIVLQMEWKSSPASGAEDFSACMRFLQEFSAGDALKHNSPRVSFDE